MTLNSWVTTGLSAMPRWIKRTIIYGLIGLAALPLLQSHSGTATTVETADYPLPEFTHPQADAWINSPPLSVKTLKGKVVLINVWTFACWNCYRPSPMTSRLSPLTHRIRYTRMKQTRTDRGNGVRTYAYAGQPLTNPSGLSQITIKPQGPAQRSHHSLRHKCLL